MLYIAIAIIGLAWLIKGAKKRCPTCAEKIPTAAVICRFCRTQQPPKSLGLGVTIAMVTLGLIILVMIKTAIFGPSEAQAPATAAPAAVKSSEQSWVMTPDLDRHTCASEKCGIVGRLFFRQKVFVLQQDGAWARITAPYDANCKRGRSRYVDKGNALCTSANGIARGQFAEWVKSNALSSTEPPDPAQTATNDDALVAQSQDFAQHRAAFVTAARTLIKAGKCSATDFKEMGGWMKSSNDRDRPVYFTYCGGMGAADRIYLNVSNGRVYS